MTWRRRALRGLVVLALLATAALAIPTGAAAQSPSDAPTSAGAVPAPEAPSTDVPSGAPAAPAQCNCPTIDIFGLLQPALERMLPGLFNRALTGLLDMLVNGLRWLVGLILSSSLNFVTQTPAGVSYDHPTVVALSGRIRAVANAALALIVLWGGFNIILRRHLAASYHTAMELGPRLIVGALLVNTSHWWTRLVVDANNALCQVVGATSLPFWERVTTVGNPEVQARLDLYGTLLYLIACLLLVIQMLVRLALVDVLLVVAPLGLACWVLPQTQGWARLWSSTFTGAVFVQFAQVVALALGGQLLVQLAPSGIDTMAVTPFLGFAALWLALRIPSLIAVEFTQVFPRPPVLGSGNRPATAATAKAQGRQMVLKGFERFVR